MKLWLSFTLSVLICQAGIAQTSDSRRSTRLSEIVQLYSQNNYFTGAVLVADGDQIILSRGYGLANIEWKIQNGPDAKFRIGSLTKQFTAALVLLLQQDGKLRIEDPVTKYLPDSPKSWEKVKIAYLLNQNSGIPDYYGIKGAETWVMAPHTPADILAFFRDQPLDFEPGSKWAYSNSNYQVLGALIERVSGAKYGELLQKRILDPLGMNDTGLDTDELILSKRAQGYMPGDKGLVLPSPPTSITTVWAAGGMYSTTGDLLKWESGLFSGKVLSTISLKLMTTPGMSGYGFGIAISERNSVRLIEHAGYTAGYCSSMRYAPGRHVTVVVLSNICPAPSGIIGHRLMDVLIGTPPTSQIDREPNPLAKGAIPKLLGSYDLWEGSLTISQQGDELLAQFPPTVKSPVKLRYEGEKDGHLVFFVPVLDGEIEFLPDKTGAIMGVLMHLGDQDIPGDRH